MKSNKGITLISLIIYIIVLLMVMGLISTFTRYFYHNVNEITLSDNTESEYSKFTSFFTSDLPYIEIANVEKHNGNTYLYLKLFNRKYSSIYL